MAASKDEGRGAVKELVVTAFVYLLCCADGSYYVGTTRKTLEERVAEHNSGLMGGYTASRKPVTLVWSLEFANVTDAITMERRVKGWSRAKKEALIAGDFEELRSLASRKRQ